VLTERDRELYRRNNALPTLGGLTTSAPSVIALMVSGLRRLFDRN
jgi:hypothetical protein